MPKRSLKSHSGSDPKSASDRDRHRWYCGRYFHCNRRCRHLRSLLPDSLYLLPEHHCKILYKNPGKQCLHQRYHPVFDLRILCHVLCHGILRNPCCHLNRPHVHLHKQICDLPADEHHPHGSRYVHGHHACNPDLYTNLPSDRTESRNDRYPVWRYADLQHVPWKYYTACRLCSVRRLWNQQDQYRRSNKNSASLFCSPVPSVISSYLYTSLIFRYPYINGTYLIHWIGRSFLQKRSWTAHPIVCFPGSFSNSSDYSNNPS